MPIVDLSLHSDDLAKSISASVEAVSRRLAIRPGERVYIIGNAADFDEFCAPAIERLEAIAAACLWPRISVSPAFVDTIDVIFIQEYIEPVPDDACVVMLQSVLLAWEEAVAMVTRVLQDARPGRIVIGACLGDRDVERRVKDYLEKRYVVDVRIGSEEYIGPKANRLEFEQRAFDLLDDRPRKQFPNMPEWVLAKILGQDYDPSAEPGFDPGGGPSSSDRTASVSPKLPPSHGSRRAHSKRIRQEELELDSEVAPEDNQQEDTESEYRSSIPRLW